MLVYWCCTRLKAGHISLTLLQKTMVAQVKGHCNSEEDYEAKLPHQEHQQHHDTQFQTRMRNNMFSFGRLRNKVIPQETHKTQK